MRVRLRVSQNRKTGDYVLGCDAQSRTGAALGSSTETSLRIPALESELRTRRLVGAAKVLDGVQTRRNRSSSRTLSQAVRDNMPPAAAAPALVGDSYS
jgi:hypothetical protein